MEKIGIVLTTIKRAEILKRCLESITNHWPENIECEILIGDQNLLPYETEGIIHNFIDNYPHQSIYCQLLVYNCGISAARNALVQVAYERNCSHILLTADNIVFTESMTHINKLSPLFDKYDVLGLNLLKRNTGWRGKLNLIPNQSFELDFLNVNNTLPNYDENGIKIWDVDIHHNFFLAKIGALLDNPWDENLFMMEHEDWAYNSKLNGIKKGWTDYCSGEYIRDKSDEAYNEIRRININKSRQYLFKKWNIKTWITYKNLPERKPP